MIVDIQMVTTEMSSSYSADYFSTEKLPFIFQINKTALLDVIADGVIIAGEPYFKRCCDLAEHIPNLFSPHFAIANLDPSSVRGLFVDSKVCAVLSRLFMQLSTMK